MPAMPGMPGMPGMPPYGYPQMARPGMPPAAYPYPRPGMPVPAVLPGTPGAAPQAGMLPPGTPTAGVLSKAALDAAPPHMRKQLLGERLFQSISRIEPVLAGKITGMLLEMA